MTKQSRLEQIKAIGNLPSPKGIALKVIRLTQVDDATNQQVADAIKSDPVLSSRVIKLANTLVAYQTRPIASISDAVSVLGFNTLRQLVLGLSLMDNYREGACSQFDYPLFWSRSLLTAITAQNLVKQSGIGATEEVFMLGLLGQIGTLALATAQPQEYGRILGQLAADEQASLSDLEYAEFGFDHSQLTQAMLADWGMPRLFQEIVLHHEFPDRSTLAEGERGWHLLNVLHLADYFSRVCLAQESRRRKMVPRLILIATRLGVEMEALAKLGDKSVSEWYDRSKQYDIRTTEVPFFAELFEAIPLVPSMLDVSEELPVGTGNFYKMRILLVDDDRANLLLLSKLLEKIGHTVVTAHNGAEGLSKVESFKPQIIITDWLMPEMNGIEFCKSLRHNPSWRNIYVFIMTAQEGKESLIEAFEAGANDFMTKPVSHKVLFARLRAGQRVVQLQEEMEFDRQQLRNFADELAASNHRLRESEITMRAILDNSPYMAWLKDPEGRYLNVNKAYVDYVRQESPNQVIGKTDFDLWPRELAEQYRAADAEVMASLQQRRIEELSLDGDKTHWVETFKTPVIDERGKVLGTTGFARDITDRIEQEKMRLTEVKKQRDVLVREVHHRIKNNLQGVVGLLRQHVIRNPELGDVIKTIIGRIYAIAIIHGFQAQDLTEEVDLEKLIKSIAETSGIQFEYSNALANPVHLSREEAVPIALVLNELYTNACKHRAEGSIPAISLSMDDADTIVTISNRIDIAPQNPAGNGQGLHLIKSLLPGKSTGLTVERDGNEYSAILRLSPPVTIL